MSEVKVTTEKSVANRQAPACGMFNDLFTPMLPLGRLFGLSPFALMREFTDEMDRAFRGVGPGVAAEVWTPAVDIRQSDGNLVVTAELPGLKKEEVKVELTDDALVIEGERKQEHKEDREGFHRWERRYGRFYRSIPLPEGANIDQARAELSEGVLKVSVPTPAEKKKTRQIPVEAATKTKPAAA